jgi:small-conductance mechanosensitive channel
MNLLDWHSPLISGLLILVLMGLGLVIVQLIGRRVLQGVREMKHLRKARQQQFMTLVQILRWTVNIVIVVIALLTLLSAFGVDITPLLASVGVAGLAVSLGAQTLIKDLIGGVLILVENQYVVGDSIKVGDVSGKVERLTLRATYVRDINGLLYVVPNGDVRIVGNMTKDWSRALVDIGVAYEEDMDRALDILEEAAAAFAKDPVSGPLLLEPPKVLGPLSLGDWAFTVRFVVKTQPGKQWAVARELRKQILAVCEQEGISLPYPRQEVWVRSLASDGSAPADG